MKFKITVLEPKEIEIELSEGERIEAYLDANIKAKGLEIKEFEYIEEPSVPAREWYCCWVDYLGHRQSEIFTAPSYDYVWYNIKPKLGNFIYQFNCVLNEPARVEALLRSLYD